MYTWIVLRELAVDLVLPYTRYHARACVWVSVWLVFVSRQMDTIYTKCGMKLAHTHTHTQIVVSIESQLHVILVAPAHHGIQYIQYVSELLVNLKANNKKKNATFPHHTNTDCLFVFFYFSHRIWSPAKGERKTNQIENPSRRSKQTVFVLFLDLTFSTLFVVFFLVVIFTSFINV